MTMRSTLRLLASLSLASLAFACGDSDGKSAKDKCETLVITFCERAVKCAEQEGYDVTGSLEECEQAVRDDASCSTAKEVSENYDKCLDDSATLSCSVVDAEIQSGGFYPPDSCARVILS